MITGVASEDDCQHDMVVLVSWQDRVIGVPLAQLEPAGDIPEDAGRSVDDWRYWVDRGYSW